MLEEMLPDETSICASPESANAVCGENVLGRANDAPCVPVWPFSPRDIFFKECYLALTISPGSLCCSRVFKRSTRATDECRVRNVALVKNVEDKQG